MMRAIADGQSVGYLPAKYVYPGLIPDYLRIGERAVELATGPDTRLGEVQRWRLGMWSPVWFFWQTPIDLKALDEKVMAGEDVSRELEECFRTDLVSHLCTSCSGWLEVLALDPAEGYAGLPGHGDKKYAMARVVPCPRCQSSEQAMVKVVRVQD